MADVTKSLGVLIETHTELEGAEAAADSLERQIGKAKATGQEYTALEVQLGRLKESLNAARQALTDKSSELERARAAAAAYKQELAELEQQVSNLDKRENFVKNVAPQELATAADRVKRMADAMAAFSETATNEELARVNKEVADSAIKVGEEDVKAALKSVEATKKSIFTKGELKKMLNQLGHQFPLLGRLGAIGLNPLTAGVALAIYAFRKLNEQIDATLSLLENASQWEGFAESIRAAKSAMDEAAVSASSYWGNLDRTASAQQAIKDITDETIESLHRQTVAQAELRNAEKALELAKINAAEKRPGGISAEEATLRRAAVERKYSKMDRDAKVAELQSEFETLSDEVDKLREQQETLRPKVEAKQQAAGEAKGKAVSEAGDIETLRKNIMASDEKIKEFTTELDLRSKWMRSKTWDNYTNEEVRGAMTSELQARKAAKDRLDRLRDQKRDNDIQRQATIDDAAASERELEAIKANEKADRDRANKLHRQIQQQQANDQKIAKVEEEARRVEASSAVEQTDLGTTFNQAATGRAIAEQNRYRRPQDRTNLTPEQAQAMTDAEGILKQAAALEEIKATGGKLTQQQQQWLQEVVAVMASLSANQQTVLTTMVMQHNNTMRMANDLTRLRSEVQALQTMLNRQ